MESTKRIQRDPFYEQPLQKGYYHPSQKKKLTKKDKKICLSPEKQPSKKPESKLLKPADEEFLNGTNVYTDKVPPTGDTPSPATSASSKFNESWPESERASTIGLVPAFNLSPIQDSDHRQLHSTKIDMRPVTSDSDVPTRERVSRLHISARQKEKDGDRESTLQRYIDRFRYGQPLSREAREAKKQDTPKDFWWLKSKSPSTPDRSSTPKGDTPSPGKMKTRYVRSPLSPYSPMKNGHTSSSSSGRSGYRPNVPRVDEMTQKLQEKADRLLEHSESSLSSEPIVSTVGLGSDASLETTKSRSSGSMVEERPYRPGFIRYMQEKENMVHRDVVPGRQPGGPTAMRRGAPPDDILTQWRLQRKMEMARDKGYPSIRHLDSGRGPASPKKTERDPKIESKLADFRNRLTQASSGKYSSPLKPSSNVHFTPSPPRQEKQMPNLPVREEPALDTPGPQPPIASPTLKRKPGAQDQIEPHLHLMCDILPCPHQSEQKKWVEECAARFGKGRGPEESGNREVEIGQESPDDEDRVQQYENSCDFSGEGRYSKIGDEARKISEKSGYLEKDTTEVGTKGERQLGIRKSLKDVSEKDCIKAVDISDSFDDIPVRDSGPSGSGDLRPSGSRVSAPSETKESRPTEPSDSEARESRPVSDDSTPSDSRTGNRTLGKKTTETRTNNSEWKPVVKSQKQKRGTRNVPQPKSARESPLKHDSSVDNAVGAVIAERMFISPTSSVDSFMSEKNKQETSSEQDTLSSDAEEFADDELLRQLRKQRDKFESKLKMIDQLLEQTKELK